MSGILQGLIGSLKSAASSAADAYFNLTTLLLNTSSTNGAQNNTFLDSSTNNFTITRNGNTTQGTFTPFSQTGWSNYFNGSSSLDVASNAALALGTGDFTYEIWLCDTATPPNSSNPSHVIGVNASGGGVLRIYDTGIDFNAYAVGSPVTYSVTRSIGVWYHLAYTRSGTTGRLFYNGSLVATGTDSNNYTSSSSFIIGSNPSTGQFYTGYASNARIVKGTALYTSSFTPSTTPLTAVSGTSLLACQSNRFLDSSTNALAITVRYSAPSVQAFSPFAPTAAYDTAVVGGSGYFDGSGDYLSLADNAAFAVPGQYTIEFWAYVITTPTSYASFYCGSGSGALQIGYDTGSGGVFGICRSAQAWELTTAAFALNQWVHVAITRDASNVSRIFYNGVLQTSATITTSYAQASVAIGSNNSTGYINGYISNFRYLKGTALYTAAFTPPTAPLTAITNTQLLLNHTNAGIYDSAAKNVLETVGNAQVSTTQAKWGTTSLSFGATSDLLQLQTSNKNTDFGTGDFTVEFWLYPTSWPSNGTIVYKTSVFSIQRYGANNNLGVTTSAGWLITDATLPSTGSWVHVAVTRSGTSVKIWINGTQSGSTGTSSASISFEQIGGQGSTISGYIDDFRATKGYARYTTTFTPPTAAFPLQ